MKRYLPFLLIGGAVLLVVLLIRRKTTALDDHLADEQALRNLSLTTSGQQYKARQAFPGAAVGYLPLVDAFLNVSGKWLGSGQTQTGVVSPTAPDASADDMSYWEFGYNN